MRKRKKHNVSLPQFIEDSHKTFLLENFPLTFRRQVPPPTGRRLDWTFLYELLRETVAETRCV